MPASCIDRFSSQATSYVLPGGGTFTAPAKRNEMMERISRNCRSLRGNASPTNALVPAQVGRNDSMEQLLVRLGAIPIITYPNPTSLTGSFQSTAGRRPTPTEYSGVFGAVTVGQTFAAAAPMLSAAFGAGGANQVLSATNSLDSGAKGRALITIVP